MPVTHWELDKYLLNVKGDSVAAEVVRKGCIALKGVVDKIIQMTPRFLLGIIQEEMTPNSQVSVVSV